jgi:hypothetical protein
MSYDCAQPSIRTLTSGSARQSARTRSTMSSGTSIGARTRGGRRAADEPPSFRGRTERTYRRNAARVAAAVELKYSGGWMKPHSRNLTPSVTARR